MASHSRETTVMMGGVRLRLRDSLETPADETPIGLQATEVWSDMLTPPRA